ncbi:RES family NAD+ phosphorylase [bacterium]|nr:RES family NAD+ phosphorylase [bacterium]MBP9809918.1 RES family NAD+ phosphorylase [bacterium]
METPDILATVLLTLPAVPINSTYHRSVANASLYQGRRRPKYLYALGPGREGARFTPKGGPPCLYVSAEPVTTLSEATGIASALVLAGLAIPQPMSSFSMTVYLHRGLLDLTDTEVLAKLGTDLTELDGPWEQQVINGDPVPTQILATAAYASKRFQVIRFYSHEDPGKVNIVIWTEMVKSPSAVVVIDGTSTINERIPRIHKKRV